MSNLRRIALVMLQPAARALRAGEMLLRHRFGLEEPEDKLVRDAQRYWNRTDHPAFHTNAHWRDAALFADPRAWQALGAQHLELYRGFARALGLDPAPRRIVEWGCGGGANAVHFAPLAEEFVGVDLSRETLDECARQLSATPGAGRFRPVLIDAARPEEALAATGGGCDLFLCTFVFELLPTPEYGLRLLEIAREMLAEDGMAMVQIKYSDGSPATAPRRWGYDRNIAHNATYGIEAFWRAAAERGLAPRMLTLMPRQPIVDDGPYAYFALQRSRPAAVAATPEAGMERMAS